MHTRSRRRHSNCSRPAPRSQRSPSSPTCSATTSTRPGSINSWWRRACGRSVPARRDYRTRRTNHSRRTRRRRPNRRHLGRRDRHDAAAAHLMIARKVAPPRAPAFLMGLGLGGFIDGIVFHQILQWHHMLTDTGDHPGTTLAGLEDNTLADGFFHLATWLCVVAAMLLTVRAWQRGERHPPGACTWACSSPAGERSI